MEDSKVRYCQLCLVTIHGENYELIDNVTKNIRNLGVTLLRGDDDDSKHVACNACSQKLFAALKFKLTCLSTNNTINSYAQDPSVFPFDLKEAYKKESGSDGVSDVVKICGLCMLPIKNISECKSINESQADMLHKFVPEMNFVIMKDPVVCLPCLDSLTMHYNFLKNVEQNIGNISYEYISNGPLPTPSDDVSVKIEDVDIKFEEDISQLIKTESLDIDCEEVKTESEIHGQGTSSEAAVKYNHHEAEYETSPEHEINQAYSSTVQRYKCADCNFETKHKWSVKKHMLTHKDPSELQIYKCDVCNYETKDKGYLKKQRMNQEYSSTMHMYKCEIKCKASLSRHMLMHKDPSEVQIYKCKDCNFESKYKGSITRHILTHKDPSELQMYKCNDCNFKSKHRCSIRTHVLMHKDPSKVQMYKCEVCNHETRQKGNLKIHMLKHKNPSETQMYKCEICKFETKDKNSLKRHVLIHKYPAVQYECEHCYFKNKLKWCACGNTQKSHKDPSEVQMYKCEVCNHETKQKRSLKVHMLRHKNPSETRMYKCEKCKFETKDKNSLKRHMLIHKYPAVQYECEHCYFNQKLKWCACGNTQKSLNNVAI